LGRADIPLQHGRRPQLDSSGLEARANPGQRARRRTACLPGLVDTDAQSEEALIVALAVEVAARIAVLAGEQSRRRERPRALDVEDGVAVADRSTTTGDDGGERIRCQ